MRTKPITHETRELRNFNKLAGAAIKVMSLSAVNLYTT